MSWRPSTRLHRHVTGKGRAIKETKLASVSGIEKAFATYGAKLTNRMWAVWQRQGTEPVILHSDRGSQFRSCDYQKYLLANALVCSMSAVGHCGDNAACEGFFGLLKRERIYRTTYPTLDAARADVFEYIERRHNPRMRRRTAREDLKFSTLSQPSVISG
jgi:putative transposase